MATDTIDHTTLARLVEAGAVRGAHVVGQAGGWAVLVEYGLIERPLATQRGTGPRLFKKMETLVAYLKGLGLATFDVDAANYNPETPITQRRPDRADALKRAHEAAAHDEWFRQQVQEGIDDTRPALGHDEVMAKVQAVLDAAKANRAAR